jgi:hypothetical protein
VGAFEAPALIDWVARVRRGISTAPVQAIPVIDDDMTASCKAAAGEGVFIIIIIIIIVIIILPLVPAD